MQTTSKKRKQPIRLSKLAGGIVERRGADGVYRLTDDLPISCNSAGDGYISHYGKLRRGTRDIFGGYAQ